MFAPEGFHTFEDISGFCGVLAGLVSRRPLFHDDGELNYDSLNEKELLGAWMLAHAMTIFPAYVCSPSGAILKATSNVTRHADQLAILDWLSLDDPGSDIVEVLNRIDTRDVSTHPYERFFYIDYNTGCISSKKKIAHPSPVFPSLSQQIELEVEVIEYFNHWSVCFNEKDFPKSDEEFLNAIGLDAADYLSNPSTGMAPLGRPRLQEVAKTTYFEVYPKGHGGVPWKIVEDRVSKALGRRVSAKTIQRAIGQN